MMLLTFIGLLAFSVCMLSVSNTKYLFSVLGIFEATPNMVVSVTDSEYHAQ